MLITLMIMWINVENSIFIVDNFLSYPQMWIINPINVDNLLIICGKIIISFKSSP